MELTVHRGTHQIGGTCIEVRSGSAGILLDVGLPLDTDDRLAHLSEGKNAKGQDLLDAGVLTNVTGIYRWDKRVPAISAILISHPHLDHYGMLRYIKPEIPVYMGEQGWKIISAAARVLSDDKTVPCAIQSFKAGKPFAIGCFRVTPYLMDHSAFDSYAFHITDGEKAIIYTGDFRAHGRKAKAFEYFLQRAPKNVDALLIEGTMMSRRNESVPTEKELEQEIRKICLDTKENLVLAYCSAQNIDRLVTFFRAAHGTGRMFVVDIYTAHILAAAAEKTSIPAPGPAFPDVRVFYPRRLCRRINKQGNVETIFRFKGSKIDKNEIRKRRSEIVMLIRPSVQGDLEYIGEFAGAALVYSLWSGYLKESYTSDFVSWLESQGCKKYVVHTSGHATASTLKTVIDELKPKEVIPVHTESPQSYDALFGNVRRAKDGEAIRI